VVTSISVTANYPTGTVADDFIVAFVYGGDFDSTSGGTVSAVSSGWNTHKSAEIWSTKGAQVFTHTSGGETSATFSLNRSTSTLDQTGIHVVMVTLRGVDTGTPVNAIGSASNTSTFAGDITAPSVTTTVSDCRILIFSGVEDTDAADGTYPAGTTELLDLGVDHGDNFSVLTIGTRTQASAGATGSTLIDYSSVKRPTAWTVAIAPALNATKDGADTATGTESQSITATRPAADTGTGTEPASLPITIRPGSGDTGTGTESQRITANRPAADTGSGGESQTISATVTASDTGTSSESALAINTAVGNDTGSFTDSVGRIDAKPVPSDTSVGTESTTIAATAPAVSDTGSSTENATGGSSVPTADSSNPATESNRITVLQSDTVTATENASFVAGVFAGDAGVGSDVAVPGPVAITDTATAFESAYIFIEGVGVIGNRVERIQPESRRIRSQRDPHVYQIKPENRLRIFGRDDRTVKVAPSKYDPVRVYSVEGEGV